MSSMLSFFSKEILLNHNGAFSQMFKSTTSNTNNKSYIWEKSNVAINAFKLKNNYFYNNNLFVNIKSIEICSNFLLPDNYSKIMLSPGKPENNVHLMKFKKSRTATVESKV